MITLGANETAGNEIQIEFFATIIIYFSDPGVNVQQSAHSTMHCKLKTLDLDATNSPVHSIVSMKTLHSENVSFLPHPHT